MEMFREFNDPVHKDGSHFGSQLGLVMKKLGALIWLSHRQTCGIDNHIVSPTSRSCLRARQGRRRIGSLWRGKYGRFITRRCRRGWCNDGFFFGLHVLPVFLAIRLNEGCTEGSRGAVFSVTAASGKCRADFCWIQVDNTLRKR